MDSPTAVQSLSALGHDTRLAVYRMLVETGPEGLPAGVIAERLGMPPSSLTFHLQMLHRAGLTTQRRASRQIIYAADYGAMHALLGFLTENCCGGGSAAWTPACCPAEGAEEAAPPETTRRSA